MKMAALVRLMLRLLRGDAQRALLEVVDYLMAEVRILRQKYEQDCGQPSVARRPEELPHRRERPTGAATDFCSATSNAGNSPRGVARSSGPGMRT